MFFRKRSLEQELEKNPNQPDKWIKLARKNSDAKAAANAVLFGGAAYTPELISLLKEGIINWQELQKALQEEKLKEAELLIKAILEEESNPQVARNIYEELASSKEYHTRCIAKVGLARVLLRYGLREKASFLLDSEEAFPPYLDKELRKLRRELKGGGILKAFSKGLEKTRKFLDFSSFKGREINEELFEELEEKLVLADVGVKTSLKLVEFLRTQAKKKRLKSAEQLLEELKNKLLSELKLCTGSLNVHSKPSVILVLGVNGVGKTTTIGKLAKKLKDDGRSVLLAAADTFRAAAVEQLETWAQRVGVRIVKGHEGADPAAVVFDAIQSAKSKGDDVIIVDTAGRLHNKENLMKEIKKIKKVIARELPGEPSEIILVLDANTGQNALSQAKVFREITDVSAIALTKLDSTAKGGIVIAICSELKIPIKLVGVGEKVEDLKEFSPEQFVEALFSEREQN